MYGANCQPTIKTWNTIGHILSATRTYVGHMRAVDQHRAQDAYGHHDAEWQESHPMGGGSQHRLVTTPSPG